MTEQLNKINDHLCSTPPAKYDDLSVLFLNCTLSRTPVMSHTEALLMVAQRIFEANGVKTEILRPVDYVLPAGLGQAMLKAIG